MALGVGAKPTELPTHAITTQYWMLDQRGLQHKQTSEIGVYACTLQCVAEASVGCSWTMEDQSITPKVSKLVETFLAATRMHMPPCVIRECWPMLSDDIPQQNLQGVCGTIVRHLDEVATHQLSLTAWDTFAFLAAQEEHWKEDCPTI